jgi:hypothetical protein
VDDLALLGAAIVDTPPESAPTSAPEQPAPAEQPQKPSMPCAGALILPMTLVAGLTLFIKKHE